MKVSFWKECECTKYCMTKESTVDKRCNVKKCEMDCDQMNGKLVELESDSDDVIAITCEECNGTKVDEKGRWCFHCLGRGVNYEPASNLE